MNLANEDNISQINPILNKPNKNTYTDTDSARKKKIIKTNTKQEKNKTNSFLSSSPFLICLPVCLSVCLSHTHTHTKHNKDTPTNLSKPTNQEQDDNIPTKTHKTTKRQSHPQALSPSRVPCLTSFSTSSRWSCHTAPVTASHTCQHWSPSCCTSSAFLHLVWPGLCSPPPPPLPFFSALYTHTHIHINIHTHTHTCMCVCTHTHTCARTHGHTNTHLRARTHTHTHTRARSL